MQGGALLCAALGPSLCAGAPLCALGVQRGGSVCRPPLSPLAVCAGAPLCAGSPRIVSRGPGPPPCPGQGPLSAGSPLCRGPSVCSPPLCRGPSCVCSPFLCAGPPLCAGAPLCAGNPSVQEPLSVPSSRFLKIRQDSPRFPFRTSTRTRPRAQGPRAPLVFLFLFPPPLPPPSDRPTPHSPGNQKRSAQVRRASGESGGSFSPCTCAP